MNFNRAPGGWGSAFASDTLSAAAQRRFNLQTSAAAENFVALLFALSGGVYAPLLRIGRETKGAFPSPLKNLYSL